VSSFSLMRMTPFVVRVAAGWPDTVHVRISLQTEVVLHDAQHRQPRLCRKPRIGTV